MHVFDGHKKVHEVDDTRRYPKVGRNKMKYGPDTG
jgi:hypothetical protein